MVDRLRKEYAAQGHEIITITAHDRSKGSTTQNSHDEAGDIISVPANFSHTGRHRRVVSTTEVLTHLDQVFKMIRPNAVHAHNVHTALTYPSLHVARSYAKKVILTAHDTFLISFARVGGERYRESVKEGKQYRLSVSDHLKGVGRGYWPLRNREIRKILQSSVDQVLSVSCVLQSFLKNHDIVSTVIHNGVPSFPLVDLQKIKQFRESHGITGETILFGGRVSVDKGSMAFARALQLLRCTYPSVTALIPGPSERISTMTEALPEGERSSIRSLGWLSQDEMNIAYAASDIVTTPSLYLDAFNLIQAEAMSAGRPVVTSIYGAGPEIVQDGMSGVVCDPLDTVTYAQAMENLLTDSRLRTKMGITAKARIESEFTVKKQAQEYLRLLSE